MKSAYVSYFGAQKPLVQTQVIPYLRMLVEEGHEVWLVTYEEAAEGEMERRARIAEDLRRAKIHWIPLRYHKTPSLPATMYDVAVGIGVLSYLVLRHGVEVIHARNHVPGAMALAVAKLTGAQILFDMRGVMAEEYVDAGVWKEGGLPYRIVKRVEHQLFSRADSIIMLTQRIRDVLTNRYAVLRERKVPIQVIPCCADLEAYFEVDGSALRQSLGLRDCKVMVYAGSTGGWYMLEEMARLARVAKGRNPKMHFLVLTQTSAADVARTLGSAGLSSDDYTVRAVTPKEMPAHLAAADFAVSFIRPSFSKISSSPTKIAEYLAAGLPILTNRGIGDVDGLVEGERLGVLVDRFDDAAYAAALDGIDALQSTPDLKERCRMAADRHFSLERVGRAGYRNAYAALQRPR